MDVQVAHQHQSQPGRHNCLNQNTNLHRKRTYTATPTRQARSGHKSSSNIQPEKENQKELQEYDVSEAQQSVLQVCTVKSRTMSVASSSVAETWGKNCSGLPQPLMQGSAAPLGASDARKKCETSAHLPFCHLPKPPNHVKASPNHPKGSSLGLRARYPRHVIRISPQHPPSHAQAPCQPASPCMSCRV